jgi:hypothetical protein
MLEYYAFRFQQCRSEGITLISGDRLFQQYVVVDTFTPVENMLQFIINNNKNLRSEIYKGIQDALHKGDISMGTMLERKLFCLLASLEEVKDICMVQNYQDVMAICRFYVSPNLFITFTCNPKWQEIAYALASVPGKQPSARPDIVSRVFRLKVDELVLVRKKKGTYFGKAQAGRC